MRLKRKALLLLSLGLLFLIQAGGICWSQVIGRVSVDTAGSDANGASDNPSTSSDGRYVAFESFATNLVANDTNTDKDIFVHDRQTGTTTRVSVDSAGVQGNGDSNFPSRLGIQVCVKGISVKGESQCFLCVLDPYHRGIGSWMENSIDPNHMIVLTTDPFFFS